MAWKRHGSGDGWNNICNHPLAPNDDSVLPFKAYHDDAVFKAGADGNQDYLNRRSRAQSSADGHILVDGMIMAPCLGPVLTLNHLSGILSYDHVEDPMSLFASWGTKMMLDPFDPEEAVARVQRFWRKEILLDREYSVSVLSKEGYSVDTLPANVQGVVLDILWATRREFAGTSDVAVVEAVVALRRALVEAWGVDFDFDVSQYGQPIKPLFGLPVPAPDTFLPLLEQAIPVVSEAAKGYSGIRVWNTTLQRLRERAAVPVIDDDEAVMAGLSL